MDGIGGLSSKATSANLLVLVPDMMDYVRYSYLEHRCVKRIPQTVEMCLLYKKEEGESP